MNTDIETIENYLTGQLAPSERQQFEETLRNDPAAADALAFYMLTKQVARDEAYEQRKAELNALRNKNLLVTDNEVFAETATPVRTLWSAPMRWVAAASVLLLLGLGWYFFLQPASTPVANQLADQYIATHFNKLPTMMDAGSSGSTTLDSLKLGVGLFNKEQLNAAETVFHDVLIHHPTMDSALKYAGIVSLRRGNYDQAIEQFHRLSQLPDLYTNPGLFYEALAHLKRGQPFDQEQAKKLLNEVVSRNLEGKRAAEELLKQL